VAVKSLAEFGAREDDLALHGLMSVLSAERLAYIKKKTEGQLRVLTDRDRHWLRTWVGLYWLRPGNAVIKAHDCIVLEQQQITLPEPLLDLGCGDGIFTTAWRGFAFDPDFDMYRSLDLSSKDVYDYYEEGAYRSAIAIPGLKVAAGIDIRDSLVRKAQDLGSFEEVRVADARSIPYPDGAFGSVFTNIIDYFHSDDVALVLHEVLRVLRPGGEFLAIVTNNFFQDGMFFGPHAAKLVANGSLRTAELYRLLDRGRSSVENYSQRTSQQWQALLEDHGFATIRNITFRPQGLWKLWDTELRPFFVPLMKAVLALESLGLRAPVKRNAVGWLCDYLEMYLDELYSETGCSNLLHVRKPV
jgi:SAM-dependent methyltransferase